jgi:predicted amidophosphoribosyltransferase
MREAAIQASTGAAAAALRAAGAAEIEVWVIARA